MLDLTGRVSDVGIVVASRSVTNVLLLLFGGVLADRLPRQLVLVASSLAAAGTQGLIAVRVLSGHATIPLLAGLSAINGAVAFPASAALTPQTVPATLLQAANALLRLSMDSAAILGAIAGGILIAVAGPGYGLAIDAAAYALAAALFRGVRVSPGRLPDAARTSVLDLDGRSPVRRRERRVRRHRRRARPGHRRRHHRPRRLRPGPRRADRRPARRRPARAVPDSGRAALRRRARRFAIEQFGVASDVALQQNVPADRLARVYSYDAVGSFIAIRIGEIAVGPLANQIGLQPTLLGCATAICPATVLALSTSSVRNLRRLPTTA